MPLGVIPKNENKREEMTEIVEALHQYVPGCDDHLLKGLMDSIFVPTTPLHNYSFQVPFGADQLTVERTRNVQLSRVNSGNKKDALQGLVPFISDWHAELTLLQVIVQPRCHVKK